MDRRPSEKGMGLGNVIQTEERGRRDTSRVTPLVGESVHNEEGF